jgi:outer membrane protein OmpA-like peptidoglycan-associated protein
MTECATSRRADGRCSAAVIRHSGFIALVSAIALGIALSGAATAQDVPDAQPQDPLYDLIETLPDGLVPQAAPDDPRTPDALFAAAITELQAAHFDEARRLLELFVVRDPRHPSVPEARRHLSELYQLDSKAVPPVAPAETAATLEPPAAPVPVTAKWVTTPRSIGGRIEDSFMLEAGDRVFFAARSAELGSRARSVLAAQARWLKRNDSLSAVVEGHADDPSLDPAGVDRLAADRADAVFRRLIEEGVAPERLAISPQGKARPIATCATADCAAQNRRAVTVLTVQRVTELPSSDARISPRLP